MGTRIQQIPLKQNDQDHPHAYGDKSSVPSKYNIQLGSSPRVWGQVSQQQQLFIKAGIIPTRMGTRHYMLFQHTHCEDHPHAYGDKAFQHRKFLALKGSSPRVWGQVGSDGYRFWNTGIIPTRMGTRDRRSCRRRYTWDHPHAYGDKTKEIKENSGFTKSTA